MEKQAIEHLVMPVLATQNLILSELKWVQEGSMRILQIAIMREDGSMDLDTCAEISQVLNPILDESPLGQETYVLEVCSPGAERELKTVNDRLHAVGAYVKVRFHHPIEKSLEYSGTLERYDGVVGELNIRIKAARKKIVFEENNIAKMNLAVKI